MSVRRAAPFLSLVTIALVLLASPPAGAQPKKEGPKLPPINPANAKLLQTFHGLDGPGHAVAASDRFGIVAAACDRNTIHLWGKDAVFGIRSGNSTVHKLTGHAGVVLDLAWDGGPVLASSGADRKVLLWNVAGASVRRTIETPTLVRALAMSPDGKLLAGAGDDTAVYLWEIGSDRPARQLNGHKDWVRCLAFSSDGTQLVSGGYEDAAILWDVAKGEKLRILPAPPPQKPKEPPDPVPVTQVCFSHDGKTVYLGRANGAIDQVNAANGQKVRTLTGHASAVTGLCCHASGALLVSSSKDGSLRLWNPVNGQLYKEMKDHTAWVEDVALLAEGTMLASVSADRTVRIWSLTP